MATTLTSDAYLDDLTGKSAGEVYTLNGAILTVRTDTRWHANSPASMTGTLGSVTISSTLGGGYYIDGTKVRWLAYDNGSGNVPAVGTSITQGGVTGTLLGVWDTITSAPTAVGAAMPTNGFIKFREVTGGTFAAGALTGIGANATAADVVGWIEVVHDWTSVITVPRLGKLQVRGDWFDLGTTSGSANQVVQLPTNGSATAYCEGLWIETAPSAGTYEFYPAIYAALFINTNFGTDARNKYVMMGTDGTARIGHDGTNAVGYVPASGCKIRVPNVFLRGANPAARATTVLPSTSLTYRVRTDTSGSGVIDIQNALSDWYHNTTTAYSVTYKHFATFDLFPSNNTTVTIEDGGNGCCRAMDYRSMYLTYCTGTVKDWSAVASTVNTAKHGIQLDYCDTLTLQRVKSAIVGAARHIWGYGRSFWILQSNAITIDDCYALNAEFAFTTCTNSTIDGLDYCETLIGTTENTSGYCAITVANSSSDCTVRDLTLGLKGTIANQQPYDALFRISNTTNITIKEIGTRAAFLNCGDTNTPAYIINSGGGNTNLKVQRVYASPMRTAIGGSTTSDKGVIFENVYGDFADTVSIGGSDSFVKNCGATNTTTGRASVYGTHFFDVFTSDTEGRLVLAMNENSTATSTYVTTVAGTPKFTSAGNITMQTLNDEVIIEQSYFTLGCTGLANSAPTVTGTNVGYSSGATWGNHDIYYQINTGTAWNGTWKDLTAENLSSETITPETGFKLKFRIVCSTAATNNLLTYIRVDTTSTLAAQTNNLYPLDTVALSVTGLINGSKVAILESGTETALAVLTAADNEINYTISGDMIGQDIDIVYMAAGYNYEKLAGITLGSSDMEIPVSQSVDYSYNGDLSATVDFDGATHTITNQVGTVAINVVGLYTSWVDWALTNSNLAYNPAFITIGGNEISGDDGTYVPTYAYLQDEWSISPDEADHTLAISGGVLLKADGSDPFNDTTGDYVVRINYKTPVEAISVSTTGGGGASAADVWAYGTRTLSSGGVTSIQSGLATSTELSAIDDKIDTLDVKVDDTEARVITLTE
jgi:hypothetical protein